MLLNEEATKQFDQAADGAIVQLAGEVKDSEAKTWNVLGVIQGSDPKQSVLNQFQQSHDIKNLFVMDASGFPSGACQNPTLTIMAMAVRSTDHLINELKRRNI